MDGAVKVCDLTRLDGDDDSSHDDGNQADGLSDWYDYPSSVDHPCRGRREAVLGTEWIDEAAYLKPHLSLL